MAVNAYLTPLTVPANSEFPGTLQGLVNVICQYAGVAGLTELGGINFGPTTPSEANRDKPWFKTDESYNPIGFFAWNGSAWVTFDTGAIPSGPTASRPASPTAGQLYLDTDINCVLVYERAKWRTADGSPGDVKFVKASTLSAALTNNPGWVEDTVGQNYVIAGASSTHTYGSTAGAETHQLTEAELPAHSHTVTSPQGSEADNGDSGPYIITSEDQPTGSPAFNGASSSTGSGTAHNNLQPTRYLWCLVKE